jgi:hypothetical protein
MSDLEKVVAATLAGHHILKPLHGIATGDYLGWEITCACGERSVGEFQTYAEAAREQHLASELVEAVLAHSSQSELHRRHFNVIRIKTPRKPIRERCALSRDVGEVAIAIIVAAKDFMLTVPELADLLAEREAAAVAAALGEVKKLCDTHMYSENVAKRLFDLIPGPKAYL